MFGLPAKINSFDPKFALSFHCNAFNGTASGTEVLYWASSINGLKIAQMLQTNIVSCIQLPDRGVKPISDSDRGGYQLKNVKCPIVILEPFFIDNNSDYERIQEVYNEYIDTILNSIYAIDGVI